MKASLIVLAAVLLSGTADAALVYTAHLDGPSESTPNASPGTGLATVTYDSLAQTLHVIVSFTDLVGTTR